MPEGIRLPERPVAGVPASERPSGGRPALGDTGTTLDAALCGRRVEAVNAVLREVHEALHTLGRSAHLGPSLADATAGVRLRALVPGQVRLDADAVWAALERQPAPARASLLHELLDAIVERALEVAGDHLPATRLDAVLARLAGWTRRTGT